MPATTEFAPVKERRVVAAAVIATCALLAIIESSRMYVSNALAGRNARWIEGFVITAPTWFLIALLAPIPLAVAGRVSIGRVRPARALAWHLGGATLFAVTHTIVIALFTVWQRGTMSELPLFLTKFSSQFGINLIIYGAIAGLTHALQFYHEARARELAASRLQASLTTAQLSALRSQINPHFLFNTLNAISTMALNKEHEKVVATLGFLGELLRASLDEQQQQEVPLEQELATLEYYLDIQRTRLGDRLSIVHDIAPDTLPALVPSMILQPLVENAVTHGIAKIPGPGTITLHVSRARDDLRIDVMDSGPGFRPPRAGSGEQGEPNGLGIGLANTKARLQQLYGSKHAIVFSRADGRADGACVSLRLPFHTTAVLAPQDASR